VSEARDRCATPVFEARFSQVRESSDRAAHSAFSSTGTLTPFVSASAAAAAITPAYTSSSVSALSLRADDSRSHTGVAAAFTVPAAGLAALPLTAPPIYGLHADLRGVTAREAAELRRHTRLLQGLFLSFSSCSTDAAKGIGAPILFFNDVIRIFRPADLIHAVFSIRHARRLFCDVTIANSKRRAPHLAPHALFAEFLVFLVLAAPRALPEEASGAACVCGAAGDLRNCVCALRAALADLDICHAKAAASALRDAGGSAASLGPFPPLA
jgi:hypothetical protein